jgi:opacity protein-like surface antigen
MNIERKRVRSAALACAALALLASTLAAQIPTPKPEPAPEMSSSYRDRVPHGFYLSLQAVHYWGFSFPAGYYLEAAGPLDLQSAFVTLDSMMHPKAVTVPGFAVGFSAGQDPYFGTLELSYSQASSADAPETFTQVLHFDDHDETSVLSYTQTSRKTTVLDATVRFGAFPVRGLNLALYGTAGAAYLRFEYQSPASAAIKAQGLNTDALEQGYLKDATIADPGTYQGNGAWSRGQFGFEFGAGLEWLIGARVGLRVDYKYISGSVKTQQIVYGAIPVQVDVRMNYTFGNRLAAALTYYF